FATWSGCLVTQATSHFCHSSSRHIGSGSSAEFSGGVGTQTHLLVPGRSTAIAPSAPGQSLIVACPVIEAGPARMASAIFSAFEAAVVFGRTGADPWALTNEE